MKTSYSQVERHGLEIGWAETDITPPWPVCLRGQFHARVSEEVHDRLTATACAFRSGGETAVLVSCDLVAITSRLENAVRDALASDGGPGVPNIIINATHTHSGPVCGEQNGGLEEYGVDLGVKSGLEYVAFAAPKIAAAVREALSRCQEGAIAYGLEEVVIGRNRRWVDRDGRATMYNLRGEALERFSHVEGYEDHTLNLLAAYDRKGVLTGLIVNIPCPSQHDEGQFIISADFWFETRAELRRRFGSELFILPQCSAAGDLSQRLIWGERAYDRMLQLKGRSHRQEIATRIADAVERLLPLIHETREEAPNLRYETATVETPTNALTREDVDAAEAEGAKWETLYRQELARLEEDPRLKEQPRWYVAATRAYRRASWYAAVAERFESQSPTVSVPLHCLCLGEIAFISNPFEYYLDFGLQVKLRSPFLQTFFVQLAGGGTYVSSPRASKGGGYGSVAASNPVGCEGGQVLADASVALLRSVHGCDGA